MDSARKFRAALERIAHEKGDSISGHLTAAECRRIAEVALLGSPSWEDGNQTSPMTQEAARGEMRRLEGDHEFRRAYIDRGHPGHGEAVRRMTELAERANPFAVQRAGR